MSEGLWTNQEVANKIDWEGGTEEALRWGIRWTAIADKDLAREWRRLEELFASFEDQRERVQRLLPEPGDDW